MERALLKIQNKFQSNITFSIETAWNRGRTLAEGQNFARVLMETPANHMTPTRIGEIAKEKLGTLDNVTVEVRCVLLWRPQVWAMQSRVQLPSQTLVDLKLYC